jgi:hypothetical protein
MVKKGFILTLLFLFFVSTTGLPFSVEFCNILNKAIKTECSLLTSGKAENELNCPFEMEKAAPKSITFKDENCCSKEFITIGVKDSYISNKTESQNQLVNIVLPVSNNIFSETEQENSTYTYIDTSPPLLQSNTLYINNSVLLI